MSKQFTSQAAALFFYFAGLFSNKLTKKKKTVLLRQNKQSFLSTNKESLYAFWVLKLNFNFVRRSNYAYTVLTLAFPYFSWIFS